MPPQPNPGTSGTRRVVRRKPKPSARQTQQARSQQAAYGSQGRAVQRAATQQQARQQTQRAARQARPFAARPVAPKPVPVARPPRTARPLAAAPPANVRAGKPVTDVKQRRAVAVTAYNQLSGDAKRGHLAGAQKRVQQGKASETDVAILHAHSTRVQGNRKRVAATKAFNAIAGDPQKIRTLKQVASSIPNDPTNQISTGSGKGLNLKPGHTYGPARKDGSRPIRTPAGKEVGVVAPLKHPNVGSVADMAGLGKAVLAVGSASTKGLNRTALPRFVKNIPKDAAELAVTTPSSLAKVAVTAATKPKKLPGMIAAPYKELAKDPKKFATEHPVSTVLMLEPGRRAPGKIAGKTLRLAGKQTLERPAATLPHTTLTQARTGSRGAVTRAVQARRDVKHGAPAMTQANVQRRVDEFYDYSKQHLQRATASAAKEAKRRGMSKEKAAEHVSGARGGARDHEVHRMFAKEFGAPHVRTEEGGVVRPVTATEGALHNSREIADTVTRHLNEQAATVRRGAHGPHQATRRNARVPLEFQTVDAGYGQFASVPKAAAERLHKHQVVGSSKAPGAQYMRAAGRSFRGAVLPLSARWLFGQVGEAAFRAGVAGAGPADLVRFNRVVKQMNKVRKGAGDEFLARVHGGQFDLTGTAREFADGKSLAEELKGTAVEDFAHGATRVAQAAPLKKVRQAWNGYSRVVFDVINGQIETTARKAMAGQAIRQGPLMEGKLLGLTDRAIHDAAHGLQGTDAQIQAARAVDRMYGQYQKFSPEKREHLLHTTPFYPWYRNTVTFLTQTLPVDHPLKAALVADLDAATEDWRKAHGLSLRQSGGKPGFLLGTYPVGTKGQTVPAGRYLPFAPGQPLQAVGDLFLPQYANVQDILRGKDWKGADVKARDVPKEIAKSVVEAHVPGAGQVDRVLLTGKGSRDALIREISPLPKTKARPSSGGTAGGRVVKIRPVKVKPVKIRPVKLNP